MRMLWMDRTWFFFFFNDTATTEIYTLSLHDALPIFGVVCGYQVEAAPEAGHAWQVRVCPGYALAPQGDEILICAPVLFDLATGATKDEPCAPCPCPPVPQPSAENERPVCYLAIPYNDCSTRPVRVHPAGC